MEYNYVVRDTTTDRLHGFINKEAVEVVLKRAIENGTSDRYKVYEVKVIKPIIRQTITVEIN